MKILLAHNSPYFPAHGGGDKSNRLLLEALAKRGHRCQAVARVASYGAMEHQRYLGELASRSVPVASSDSGVVVFHFHGVEVRVVTNHPNLRAYFGARVLSFDPDVILASTDDPAQLLLEAALRAVRARVVYLARATLAVPFGPDCAFPSAARTESLRKADQVVGVSRYVADYIRRWSGIEAVAAPISLLEPGPYRDLGRFDNEFVTLVNPCAVKGISIFLALADTMPKVRFAAVPMWGTNEQDREALARRPNIHILRPVDNIDDLLVRTRILLVPSLWAEARSRIVVEAMLRGVPVVASDIGGIPEAKMGVDYLLPVRPIEKYLPGLDEQMVPMAEVPRQDIGPWQRALEQLMTDREHYELIARASRDAALSYASSLSVRPFEQLLEKVVGAPRRRHVPEAAEQAARLPSAIERLSPEKRQLLALRLRKKAAASPTAWFSEAELSRDAELRLFCFPHAGGGASSFLGWRDRLPSSVSVCPARLPGREGRASEAPLREMTALVAALGGAILPHAGRPYAFFGHSMGAVVAFELARYLRKRNQRLPACLFVSGARAPQFRLGHIPGPEPSKEEFLEELHRLEGMPSEVLEDPDLLRVLLPALRADSALYRNYVYVEKAPLDCPIRAYGGEDDPNIRREHLEAWSGQTTSSFSMKQLPGGHFFLQTQREQFLATLARDLREAVPGKLLISG